MSSLKSLVATGTKLWLDSIDPDLIKRLLTTDTGTIGHFVDSGVMSPRIAAKAKGAKVAGTAVTVRCTVPDSVIGHYALKFVRPGDIAGGLEAEPWFAGSQDGARCFGTGSEVTGDAEIVPRTGLSA